MPDPSPGLLELRQLVKVAVNRAARSIDGEVPAGTIPFPTREDGTKDVKASLESLQADERKVSNPHA